MAFLNNKFWQVYFLKQSEKLKFYEVLILGFIRFYSLLKQSAKLTFTNSMTAQNCVHLHARVVVPKPEFSVVDQRKIALVNELRNFRTVTSSQKNGSYFHQWWKLKMKESFPPFKSDAQKWATAKIFACDYQSLTKITPTLGASLNYL